MCLPTPTGGYRTSSSSTGSVSAVWMPGQRTFGLMNFNDHEMAYVRLQGLPSAGIETVCVENNGECLVQLQDKSCLRVHVPRSLADMQHGDVKMTVTQSEAPLMMGHQTKAYMLSGGYSGSSFGGSGSAHETQLTHTQSGDKDKKGGAELKFWPRSNVLTQDTHNQAGASQSPTRVLASFPTCQGVISLTARASEEFYNDVEGT